MRNAGKNIDLKLNISEDDKNANKNAFKLLLMLIFILPFFMAQSTWFQNSLTRCQYPIVFKGTFTF